jgi:uncharacterized membrane protein YdfJ with MMPL/SSD domain
MLVAAAVPAYALQLTPGTVQGIPRHPQAVRGFDTLTKAVGPGVVSPAQILVDAGPGQNVLAPRTQAAIGRLIQRTNDDSEVAAVFYAPGGRFVDDSRRYAQIIVAGKHEYGAEESQLLEGGRRRGSTSSTARTRSSRGSCSACSCSLISCCSAHFDR